MKLVDAGVRLAKLRTMTGQSPHLLRSDARDNRARILGAARELFATDGLDVPMRTIARRAGVGPATVYRRFPTKQALAAAAFAEERRSCRDIVDEARADSDPWRGLFHLVERLSVLHAHSRGFTEAFTSSVPDEMSFTADREHALHAVGEMARDAKQAGQLRADFVVDDLVLLLMALGGIHATSATTREAAARRLAALTIEAWRPSSQHTPLPPPAPLAATEFARGGSSRR